MVQLAILCLCCLPTFLLAAPLEDGLKQQIAAGLLRNEEAQWNFLNPELAAELELQGRSLDSLGRGHILRSLPDGESTWFGGNNNNRDNFGWRFNGYNSGGLKRGSGLDSLGGGNILRSIPDDAKMQKYFRSLDSLASNGRHLRRLESLGRAGVGLQKKFDSLSGMTFGNQKRNFDEIDNAGFGAFVKKNFDEVDNVMGMYPKRNFDEIDNAGFGAFLKRST